MRPNDLALAQVIKNALASYTQHDMPGIQVASDLDCLVEQMVDSVRRIKYIDTIHGRQYSSTVTDVSNVFFDPLKAAIFHRNNGDINEAFWLIFLATHFGKHKRTEWQLLRAIYGGLHGGTIWTWDNVSVDPDTFCAWLAAHAVAAKRMGKFGNHRKYESLSSSRSKDTCDTIVSYINWVGTSRDHTSMIKNIENSVGNNPRVLFNSLYRSMNSIVRFGRMANFDYLTMIGKLRLADIEPDHTYLDGATGPLRGARLLFGGNTKAPLSKRVLNGALNNLEASLGLRFGMQVLEDALCNWQKSPSKYKYFKG